jgi:bifunctional DNase/RNase/DNA-binding transcriptional MerR regulator
MTVPAGPGRERLLRIGPFSRQARLSPHQLRHYHELGLLLPASVDPESGYRYYAESQTATAEVIAILRSVDMPLAEIRDLLRDPSAERVQETLDRHRTRLERRLEEAGRMLGRLRELIQEGIPMSDAPDVGDLVEVVLQAVRMHAPTGQHVLLLRERAGERVLALWVGPFEANAAAMRLHGMAPARPLTHDLLAVIVERAGATVERVVITNQAEEVFYATVHLGGPAGPEEIDARPSDALNLALRSGAPVLVAARVMDEAARVPDPASAPRPPGVSAMAVEAGTGQELGLLHLRELPGPGDQVAVHAPTGWRVVSVEPAEADRPPRIVVRRPSAE